MSHGSVRSVNQRSGGNAGLPPQAWRLRMLMTLALLAFELVVTANPPH